MRHQGAEQLVVALKPRGAKGLRHPGQKSCQLREQEEHGRMTKPFDIPKALIWKAFQCVKANGGAAVRIQPVDATHFYGALEVKPLGGLFLSSVVSI
ncbi:hypothetical protein AWV80_13700 [Cupriavidus sp. UYMU48A]|nr:hypothetical protein AWV80_13700 [Cupriavidus sp. UYMU48A]